MAKYLKKKKNNVRPWLLGLLTLALILAGVGGWIWSQDHQTPVPSEPTETVPPETETTPVFTEPEPEYLQLGDGLRLTKIGTYSGLYMEDGSDEILSGVMMILLENHSDRDLQLARINLNYGEITAEFEATNLPAGEGIVLLEKNRLSFPGGEPELTECRNVVFFPEKMDCLEDTFRISGGAGYLDVENISGEDVAETVYIYYKNYAGGLYYGGITYRAKLDGGIKAGQTMRIITGHYTPESCRILMVTRGG